MYEELHVFSVIVEQSSMNKASALLNLSQPALSRKIAKLEQDIGSPLFRRIGKRLELTRIGQLTYEYAIELRQLHRKYLQTVTEFTATGRSSLTIGASLTTLQTTLPDLIQMLTSAHPEVDIKAITGKTHEIVSLVREHKADIGIVASSIEDSTLRCLPLFDDHLLLILPRNQVVTDKGSLGIMDLDGMPMILFSRGTWYRVLTDELFDKYQLQPDVRMEIDSFEAILRLLHTCRAATLLPQSYMRQQLIDDNELVVVPIRELEDTKRTTSLIHADPAGLSSSVRLWINEIAARFPSKQA
ncbi:LysR family transcriptional regulator [Paenibacillus harenae]|uniref:DNA-binding transcriptional LysR family regulator n=1 Tax=Paenibacillus harenae TaxID=306543 RepID=A0ABT9U6W1_PAEHA|nr:LysR family transcriptional regulator [Paenibacillus harenae]MDQ0060792.1 DNA-binding transcriptional LysR family regulator [Paenibacillus harenae]MDQ0115380.1 DNA-binding transcriptional LysR family regulator [Paenibacillus harenae]